MNKNTVLVGLLVAASLAGPALADPVSLGASGYLQNFDTLASTAGSTTNDALPTGWVITEDGTRKNDLYAVDTGSSNTGDIYSYGAAGSSERALGSLRSGSLVPLFGVEFINNTGATITALDIAFTGEFWRLGATGRADRLDFQYSASATTLTSASYVDFDALDFETPDTASIGAKDGNAAANRTSLSASITGLGIAAGSSFWLRWSDSDPAYADDGLAIDDFSLTARGATAPAATVPEPGSLALAGLALMSLMAARRRP